MAARRRTSTTRQLIFGELVGNEIRLTGDAVNQRRPGW
jgi:hypothetical protein